MAITDPLAIAFANQDLRPMAERLRELNAAIDDILLSWNGGVSAVVPNDAAELLEDGREAAGVSRLTGADIHNLVTQCQTIQTQFDGVGVMDVIDKPTVRPFPD